MNNEIRGRNNLTGFVPRELEIEDRPELSDFSKNILFANVFSSNGEVIIASSLYRPDFDSYRQEDGKKSLLYKNIHNSENTVRIIRYAERWEGEKIINDKPVLWASGRTWQQFFAQLTLIGLSQGERCKYERLEDLKKQKDIN